VLAWWLASSCEPAGRHARYATFRCARPSLLPMSRPDSLIDRAPDAAAPPVPEAPRQARRSAASFAQARSAGSDSAETEGLYRLLVESVQDYAIFALDPDGYILSWNAGAEHAKGYTAAEIVGQHFSIFYPPEKVAERFPEYELEVAGREGRFEDEGWRIRKDGTRFWANVVITALRNETGALVGFAKVTRDLTERRAAEESLRESEERFRLLVDSVRDYAIFMLDPTGRIATWNEGAQRIKGYTPQEIVGEHFSIFYPPAKVAEGFPEFELEEATRTGRFEDEGWRVRQDGSRFWANVVITALRNPQGTLVGFAKVTRDLTERRAAEEQRLADARRIAAAEAANKAKSEFLASMSHELRTPLNAIGGYMELLLEGLYGPVPEEQQEVLQRVRRSQQHLLTIITDLLNYSRVEAGQITYDLAPVSVLAMLDNVSAMMEAQARRKGLTLERGPCPRQAVARVDRSRAEQILLNLLSNAVKFTPEGGRVTLSCARRGDRVTVRVHDTGLGLPPDKLEAVFEPFVQLGRSLNSAHEGTGLGLAISRDLARAMGGDLTAASAPGAGATFTLTLPAA
jgi:PAS domain S-box-containing protein